MLAVPLGQSHSKVDHIAGNSTVRVISGQMPIQCHIDRRRIPVFVVGRDRRHAAMDVETGEDAIDLSLGHTCSEKLTVQFRIDHRFPTAQEGVLPCPKACCLLIGGVLHDRDRR